jgi:uncharacterized membrane protein
MTANWERLQAPPPLADPVFMDAVLTPNRSLSQRSFARLLAAFALVNIAVSVLFALQGAYPVLFFLALDVGLLWAAFHLNYRAGRAVERVRVGRAFVHVERRAPKGAPDHWVVSPLWVQVLTEGDAVRIVSAGRDVAVGAFLSPPEREAFGAALRSALGRARGGG